MRGANREREREGEKKRENREIVAKNQRESKLLKDILYSENYNTLRKIVKFSSDRSSNAASSIAFIHGWKLNFDWQFRGWKFAARHDRLDALLIEAALRKIDIH